MYKDHFGFSAWPFSITPDPRFIYDNPNYREAFAGLCYGIEARKGFIVMTGEAGTGKTTLIKAFVQRAEVKIRTALIVNPKLTVTELLRAVLNDLGVAPSAGDQGALTAQLNDYLFEQFKKGHIVALLVDEAQQLSDELLEHLRLLSNLETHSNKLIQIVLAGQPELEERLNEPELRQLKQRVTLCCRLTPLTRQEVSPYIQARLKTAGFENKALFDPTAVEKVALYSGGIPRLINVICDNALVTCYALSRKMVSAEIIEEVTRDLKLLVQSRSEKPRAPSDRESAKVHNARKNEARVLKPRPVARPAFDPDIRIAGGHRRTRSSSVSGLSSMGTGFVFGLLAAAGLGAIFYPQSNRADIPDVAARIEDANSRRENKPATEFGALPGGLSVDSQNGQAPASARPPVLVPQPGDSRGASAPPVLEASKTDSSQAVDGQEQSQEILPTKNDNQDAEIKEASAKRPSETPLSRMSARDRLKLDIYKAIANRAITGVEVFVVDRTVVLRGRVATQNQKIAAGQAARSVPGVENIRNQILISDDAGPRYSSVRSEHPSFGG